MKNLKFCPTICWLRKVSSLTKITEAIDVPLIMLITSLAMPGQDRAHRLGQDDPPQGQERSHAERGGRDALVAVHRQDAATDDLGAERGFVEREAEHRGRVGVELDANRRQRVV